MGKKGTIFTIIIALALAVTSTIFFYKTTKLSISGFAISDMENIFLKPNFSTIVFVIQWVLAIAIILYALFKHLRKQKETKIVPSQIKRSQSKSNTDLDALYTILTEKKNLKMSTIAKLFNISREKSLEWGKILENNNLARIEYPAFSEPELVIK